MRYPLAALAVAIALTGCNGDKATCEHSGGQWVQTGEETVLLPQYVNDQPVMIPRVKPIYECEGTDQ